MRRPLPENIHRPSFAEIDLHRLKRNFQSHQALLGEGTFLCPMVKANAYGHGDIEVARKLRESGATHLGVGLIEEGIRLREAGDTQAILMFGIFEDKSTETLTQMEITPVLSDWREIAALEEFIQKTSRPKKFKVHFKFNTGMNRLGFKIEDAPRLREWLNKSPRFELEGVCTHLLRGEDAGAPGGESESQLKAFAGALQHFKGLSAYPHALNSSGALNLSHRALKGQSLSKGAFWPIGSRPGLGIYGIHPGNDANAAMNLLPVMQLISHTVAVHQLKKGDRVSYGASWRADRDSVIGVVPLGYADGYFRSLSNRAAVLFRGQRAKVAGTVCMDYFMIDLTDVSANSGMAKVGEEVVLFGEQKGESIGVGELASLGDTIPYEVLTGISERVPRIYKDEPAKGESGVKT